MPRGPDATQRHQFRSPTTPNTYLGPPCCVNTTLRLAGRAMARTAEHPKTAVRTSPAAHVAPRRRKNICHGAQMRPRGTGLGPPPPPVPTGPTLVRQCDATVTDRATARAFARRRTPPNGRAGGLGGARGAAEAQKKVPRSPGATQRRQFRSPTTPSTHWAHPGASMRRYGSPIARQRARSRAAEHPKMAARAASAARAVPRRRKKR